jgi:Rha family phage regulatory protein
MTATLPTKTELLEVSIVAIDQLHKKVITNTIQLANHFLKRPSEINRRIALLSNKGLCRIAPSYYLNQQGKKQKYYELSRDQFLLVVMGFTGSKADQFKSDFIQLFNQQEAELRQWQTGRLVATDTTKQANDQINLLRNKLAETIPTSRRCTMLFIHIQRAITKRATGKANTNRDTMTEGQLLKIGNLEEQVEIQIEQLNRKGLPAVHIRDEVISMIKAANTGLDYA